MFAQICLISRRMCEIISERCDARIADHSPLEASMFRASKFPQDVSQSSHYLYTLTIFDIEPENTPQKITNAHLYKGVFAHTFPSRNLLIENIVIRWHYIVMPPPYPPTAEIDCMNVWTRIAPWASRVHVGISTISTQYPFHLKWEVRSWKKKSIPNWIVWC